VRRYEANHPTRSASLHPFWYNPSLDIVVDRDVPRVPLRIEHEAWVGAGSLLLAGCRRIGIGAVVGAGSVVTRDVPDFAIVAGNPAKLIRERFTDDQVSTLLAVQWWHRSLDELRPIAESLRNDVDSDVLEAITCVSHMPVRGSAERA
jgi:hypothetical protein